MQSVLCVRYTKTFTAARLFATRLAAAVLCGAALMAAPGVAAADNTLSFDERGERVVTTGRIPSSDFTVEAWFKLSAYTSENQIFSQYQGGHGGRLIAGIKNQVAGMFIGGVGSWHEGTATIPLNTWTHFAMTRSGSTCVLYINGNVYLSETVTANTLPDANFLIGNIHDTGPGFRGEISDVRIWNSVRSQSEISSLKNIRLSGSESDLKHYWRLNEGSGNSVADLVASEDGTIYGALWNLSLDLPILDSMPNAGAWSAVTGGNWSNSDNWIDSSVPNGVDVMAYFTNRPPAAVTITNDMEALRLGQVEIGGSSGHTLTGSALLFTNNTDASSVTATEGSHTIDLPLTTTQGELRLQTQEAAALTITDVISGASAISCNPYLAGGGSIIQQAAHNYTGITTLGCGTVEISTLPDGEAAGPFGASSSDPTNLILGPGTLRYTGTGVTTDRGYTVNTVDINGNSARAVVFDSDADVTFAGAIRATAGSFIKTGAGTLRYTYPGWNKFMANEGNPNGLLDIKDNGDSPTIGFSGFTIAEGKVALGVPGQINIFSNRVDVGMYTTTNANSEHSAELEINDGVFICSTTLSIGRNNGNTNTAPAGTTSKLTINGGECYLALVASGHNALSQPGFNPRSVYEINGGYVEQSRTVNIGEHAGSQITMNANGGHLNVKAGGASIRIGAGTGEGTLNMRDDAVVEAAGYIALALGDDPASKGTCNLNGGTLIANDIRKGNGVSAVVNFNGTIFKPNAGGQILDGLTAAYVSTNGVVFDTSLASYTIEQSLLHDPELGATMDGGLTKLGSGTLIFNAGSSTYNGDTVVSNGVLRLQTSLPGSTDLIVAPDGELQAEGTPSVNTLTIEAGGALGFGFAADGTLNDRLTITSSAVFSDGQVALYHDDTDLPFTKNGTYTIMTYGVTPPDVSGLSCANPVFGKLYTFVADSGTVTVTIANDSAGASIWNVNGSGNWATGSNWTLEQPGTAGSTARFDDAISAPVTVSTSGESAGALYFNSPFAYTIGGSGLTIDNSGAEAHLTVESGAHAITAPVTLNDDAHVEFSPGTALTLGAISGATSTLSAQGEGNLLLSDDCAISLLGLNIPNLILSSDLTLTTDLEL